MKRLPPIVFDELAQSPRRKRALSAEERELWDSVARQVKPLRLRPRVAAKSEAAADRTAAKPIPVSPPKAHASPAKTMKPAKPAPPPLTNLARRERSQLARGRKDIDARLDLHGMTQTRAHRALLSFLQRASGDGLTFVLIITGKGRSADPERGVLRRQVPQWLSQNEFRALVVGFEEAHIGHGGEGALYVRVRRGR